MTQGGNFHTQGHTLTWSVKPGAWIERINSAEIARKLQQDAQILGHFGPKSLLQQRVGFFLKAKFSQSP